MKNCATQNVRQIKVIQNTTKNKANYLKIKDTDTGEVLHQGQTKYIARVAKAKYNRTIKLAT